MPDFSIIIPFETDNGPRARIADWITAYYQAHFPEAEVIVTGDAHAEGEPLNRSRMRNRGVAQATTNLLAIVDADCLLAPETLREAVSLVRAGAPMVQYASVTWLSEVGTAEIIATPPARWPAPNGTQISRANDTPLLGLVFVLTRQTFTDAGGFDERFQNWGEEDPAFACAISAMAGPVVRNAHTAYHLWHPRTAEHSTSSKLFLQNRRLANRYRAQHTRAGMAPLVREALHARGCRRILAHTTGYLPALRAGAEVSLHALLRWLQRRGHAVEVLAAEGTPGLVDGIPVQVTRDAEAIARLYGEADVIIGNHGGAWAAAPLAKAARRPLVAMLHNDINAGQVQSWLAAHCAALVANTPQVAEALHTPHVLLPYIAEEDYLVKETGDCITLVNLNREKGAETFWALAARLPEQRFLAVRGGYGEQLIPAEIPANVEVIGPVADMREVYARTRVLLMPSSYESFGRCALEAAASGIPTIAHPTPGLRLALGKDGVFVDRDDIDGYAATLAKWIPTFTGNRLCAATKRFRDYQAEVAAQLLALEALLRQCSTRQPRQASRFIVLQNRVINGAFYRKGQRITQLEEALIARLLEREIIAELPNEAP